MASFILFRLPWSILFSVVVMCLTLSLTPFLVRCTIKPQFYYYFSCCFFLRFIDQIHVCLHFPNEFRAVRSVSGIFLFNRNEHTQSAHNKHSTCTYQRQQHLKKQRGTFYDHFSFSKGEQKLIDFDLRIAMHRWNKYSHADTTTMTTTTTKTETPSNEINTKKNRNTASKHCKLRYIFAFMVP